MGVIIKNGKFYPPTVGGNKAFYLHQDEYDALEKKKKDAMYFITSKRANEYYIKDGVILVDYQDLKDSGSGELIQEAEGTSGKCVLLSWTSGYTNNGHSIVFTLTPPLNMSKVKIVIDNKSTFSRSLVFYGKDISYWNCLNGNSNGNTLVEINAAGEIDLDLSSLNEAAAQFYLGIGTSLSSTLYIKEIYFYE